MKLLKLILSGCLIIAVVSCNNTKHLAAGQYLFTGSGSKIKSSVKISKNKAHDLEEQMQSLVRPAPNSKIFGVRFRLSVYNAIKEPAKQKGIMYWLKYKVGEPPVIASNIALQKNREIIQNHFENKGYFRDSVLMNTSLKNKKLKVVYTALLDSQYRINNIGYPGDSSALSKQIQATAINNKVVLLKTNAPYDLDAIKNERIRIDANLKKHGFFYFSPDYLIADADSTIGSHKVNLNFRVKPGTPAMARLPYFIKDVFVFTNYSIRSDTSLNKFRKYKGYYLIGPRKKYNPKIFTNTLVFKPGDIYNRTDHNLSLNRLTSLGIYKFVKVRFEPGDSAQTLNAYYYLTPGNKKSIRFEVSALQRSNNSAGANFTLNWRNRNLFKGAELLTISANTGFEKQISSTINSNIFTAGIEAGLYLPGILAPFKLQAKSAFVPQTKMSAAFQLYKSSSAFTLTSSNGTFGYLWKNHITSQHQFTLFNVNYIMPTNISKPFQQAIDTNLTLKRSIEEQFILGSVYNYNYNSQAKINNRKNNFYFNGNIDVSGNLLSMLTGANAVKGKQVKIFGTPFSQYIRLEADFRHYLGLGNAFRSLNSRIVAGVGYAYGNSVAMPFTKEFFAGGVIDMRGFRARTLGPGTFYGNAPKDSIIIDQPGDIKLLTQIEYRARLFSIVRYALFTDIGNIWTLKKDSLRPGANFTGDFLNQLAVDAGMGLRFDFSILVLRLDIAFPVRVPYKLPGGESYKIDFGSSQWRKDNLVFNLAIGYPF